MNWPRFRSGSAPWGGWNGATEPGSLADLPFDQVRVNDQTFGVADFLSLPMVKRVRLLLESTPQLFKQGAPVAATTELRALLKQTVPNG